MRRPVSARGRPTPLDEAGNVFLYDPHAFLGEAEGWVGGDATQLGSVRGRLFRGPRGRLGLVPEAGAPLVRGRLVDVPAAQLPVLDFLLGGVGGGLKRQAVDVVVSLRIVRATAWVLTDSIGWKSVKQERT